MSTKQELEIQKAQIDRETLALKQQQQAFDQRQKQSSGFIQPTQGQVNQGSLQGPNLSAQYGTGTGGSAYLLPTDTGSDVSGDKVWDRAMAPPSSPQNDPSAELQKPLDKLENVPVLQNEYRNGINTMNKHSVMARAAGFNIKKPDPRDARQMRANAHYLNIKSKTEQIGSELQEGYRVVEQVGKNPEKYATLFGDIGEGTRTASRYTSQVSSAVLPQVIEFNKREQAYEQTTGQDKEGFDVRKGEYDSIYANLETERDALLSQGRNDEAMRVQKSIDTLIEPIKTYNLDAYEAETKRKRVNTEKEKFNLSVKQNTKGTNLISRVAKMVFDPTAFNKNDNGEFESDIVSGMKYGGNTIKRVVMGTKGNSFKGTKTEAYQYYKATAKDRFLKSFVALSDKEKQELKASEGEGFKKYIQNFKNIFSLDMDISTIDDLYDENGNVKKTLLTESEKNVLNDFEKVDYGITIEYEPSATKRDGEGNPVTPPSTELDNPNGLTLLNDLARENNDLNSDVMSQILDEKAFVNQNGDLDYNKILSNPVHIEVDFNGDGIKEKVDMTVASIRPILKANYLISQGNFEAINKEVVKLLDIEETDENFGLKSQGFFGDSPLGMAIAKFEEGDQIGVTLNTKTNSKLPNIDQISIVKDKNFSGDKEFKIITGSTDQSQVLSEDTMRKLGLSFDADGCTKEQIEEFITASKLIENDPGVQKGLKKMETLIGEFQKRQKADPLKRHTTDIITNNGKFFVSETENNASNENKQVKGVDNRFDATDY